MDNPSLVATIARNDGGTTYCDSARSDKPNSSKQKRRKASSSRETKHRYLSDIRRKYALKGFSNRAIDLIIKSWRRSTVDQYVTYIKLWYNFSRQGLTSSIRNIIEFLVHLHTQGYTHDQVCAARSAMGTISNFELLGKHPDVKRVMKGMFESNPQLPKYSSV